MPGRHVGEKYPSIPVTVVSDPSGDFRTGARFGSVEFRDGLHRCVWPVGMVVTKNCKTFVIEQLDVVTRNGTYPRQRMTRKDK